MPLQKPIVTSDEIVVDEPTKKPEAVRGNRLDVLCNE
jgi:hypothetical protein